MSGGKIIIKLFPICSNKSISQSKTLFWDGKQGQLLLDTFLCESTLFRQGSQFNPTTMTYDVFDEKRSKLNPADVKLYQLGESASLEVYAKSTGKQRKSYEGSASTSKAQAQSVASPSHVGAVTVKQEPEEPQPSGNVGPSSQIKLHFEGSVQDLIKLLSPIMSVQVPPTLYREEFNMSGSHLIDADFVVNASLVKTSVGRIVIDGKGVGTGFRVAYRLIMTARHVAKKLTKGSYIQFGHCSEAEEDTPLSGINRKSESSKVYFDPSFMYLGVGENLDYAVVAIKEEGLTEEVGIVKHVCPQEEKRELLGSHVNIFSHPDGRYMKFSFRENRVVNDVEKRVFPTMGEHFFKFQQVRNSPEYVCHTADTESGSSGAPMFDDDFRLMGVHVGCTDLKAEGQTGEIYVNNVGLFIKPIIDHMYLREEGQFTEFERALLDGNRYMTLGVPFKGMQHFTESGLSGAPVFDDSLILDHQVVDILDELVQSFELLLQSKLVRQDGGRACALRSASAFKDGGNIRDLIRGIKKFKLKVLFPYIKASFTFWSHS